MDDATTPRPEEPATLLADLRAQAAAASARAAETVQRVETEVAEVRDQALAVAAALEQDARRSAGHTADADHAVEAILADAQERAEAIRTEGATQAASIRAEAAAEADDAAAALSLAESRKRTAERQAQTLRVSVREAVEAHRTEQLASMREEADARIDAALAAAARLGLALDTLSTALGGASAGAARPGAEDQQRT